MASIQDIDGSFAGRPQEFDLRVYVDILRRRWIFLLIPAVLIAAVVFWISRTLPPVFEARATILVESQQIPTALVQSTVAGSAAERIQLIQQRLLARDNLLEIARKFNLFAGQGLSPSEVVDAMRAAAQIRQIDVGRSARPDTQAIGFTVGFQYRDPGAAANVANEFVTSILQQNIQSRTTRAAETKKFFEQRVAQLEKDLIALEAKTVEFKKVNEASLPETLATRRALLVQLQASIADIDRKVAFANDPKLLEPEKLKVEGMNRQLDAKKRQLEFQKEELDSLKALAEKGVVPKNRVRDTERAISALELEIEALEADVANQSSERERTFMLDQLKQERAELVERVAALEVGIQRTPQVESELIALTRAYDNMQQEYRDAKAKASEAEVGEQLEADRQGERFEVIEQATVPGEPISPNRKRIATMGVAGGLAAGVGLMMLLEMLDKSIRTAADLERRLGMRPFASIPYVTLPGERARRRWIVLLVVVLGLAVIVASLVLIQMVYMPLDLFFAKLVARLGL